MYFLIDYENVNYSGLEGTEYLERRDTVSFFYSKSCEKIIGYRMKDIEKSGCAFEICKLKNVRKNALDFYIASKVGEIFAINKEAKIAIISSDKDHQSVLDYWRPRLRTQGQLVVSKTIAKGIQVIDGEGRRKKIVNERLEMLDLQTEHGKYEERKRIVSGLEEMFEKTEYEEFIPQVINIVLAKDKPKVVYLNSLKTFGKKSGLEVYRKIKEYRGNNHS